jgi:hypothetical protein
MAKMNILINLNAYSDPTSSFTPNLNNFKWVREYSGLAINEPTSSSFTLGVKESITLFNNSRTLSHDGTTVYDLSLKAGSANTYILKASSGTSPSFKTLRATAVNATTIVDLTKNGNLMTLTVTGGPAVNFTSTVSVGDILKLDSASFDPLNLGKFTILSVTSSSLSFENINGLAQTSITIGAGFAEEFKIFSAVGVQKEDKVKIGGSFSLLSQGSYPITDVEDNKVEFYFTGTLPLETKTTTGINVYSSSKQILYVESNKKTKLTLDGSVENIIQPSSNGSAVVNGFFLIKSDIYSLSIENLDSAIANIFVATVE